MSTSATREATNSESAAIWRVMVRVYDKQGQLQWRIPGDQPPRPYFWTKLRPDGPKKFFWRAPPPRLSRGLDDRPPSPPLSEGVDPPLSYVVIYPKSFLTKGHNTEQAEICSFSSWILFCHRPTGRNSQTYIFVQKKNHRSFLKEYICVILTQWTKFSRN